MKISDNMYCSFPNWYALFKRHTFKSVVVFVPPEVLNYLNEDGVVLPVEAMSDVQNLEHKWVSSNSSSDDEVNQLTERMQQPFSTEDGTSDLNKQLSFPVFSQKLESSIKSLGGTVFIKGNWSAPSDASWIIPSNGLKCCTIEDIYLLLKSSSRLLDNYSSMKEKSDCCIVLKKWEDIHPSSEFRCFVYNRFLIGITQRDCSDFHEYIPDARMDIMNDIIQFFEETIKDVYPGQCYSFDIARLSSGKVILIDFGMFNDKNSQTYLFTWSELLEISSLDRNSNDPEFRYVASANGVQPTNNLTGFCVPYDLRNISSDNRDVIDSLIGLINQVH